ncbi:MAG: undecaprenyl-diphosphate phosphatase [Alphaproteobacteria bacterium]|nr:undecaprenyl-diphosphate phosphatase [Alphaproteobacteria bacterium]
MTLGLLANGTASVEAVFLGLLEGLTEFIPVSSTGHLLLAGHFMGFESSGKTFEVVIQLGAILALLFVYAEKLFGVVKAAPSDPAARRFIASILVAFLPAAVVGVLAHDFIKNVLFETPALICWMLILGGIVLLVVDRLTLHPRHHDAMRYPPVFAFCIGLCQCLAMVPGVSRSGATIVGAMLMGADKRSAAEFSFFLAIPTMAGAVTYDLYKSRHMLNFDDASLIVLGFIAAFVVALMVVRGLLAFVSRRGYAPFAWWRIAVGSAGLVGLALLG